MQEAVTRTSSPKNDRKKKRWKIVLIIFLAVLLLLLIALGVVIYLALQDDYQEKYKTEPSTDIIVKGVIAAGTGDEVEVTMEELNGFFAYSLQKSREETASSFRVEALYMNLESQDGSIGVYMGCTYRSTHIGVTARGFLTFDEATKVFTFDLREMKIGRLAVSPSFILRFVGDKLPYGMTSNGNCVYLDTSNLKLQVEGADVPLELKSFRVQDGSVYVKTTGMMEAIKAFVKDQLGETLGANNELLDDLIDNFGEVFENFLKSLQ